MVFLFTSLAWSAPRLVRDGLATIDLDGNKEVWLEPGDGVPPLRLDGVPEGTKVEVMVRYGWRISVYHVVLSPRHETAWTNVPLEAGALELPSPGKPPECLTSVGKEQLNNEMRVAGPLPAQDVCPTANTGHCTVGVHDVWLWVRLESDAKRTDATVRFRTSLP